MALILFTLLKLTLCLPTNVSLLFNDVPWRDILLLFELITKKINSFFFAWYCFCLWSCNATLTANMLLYATYIVA